MDRYKRMKIHRGQPGPAYQEPLRPRKIRSTAPYLFVDGQSSPHPTSPDLLSPPSHENRGAGNNCLGDTGLDDASFRNSGTHISKLHYLTT
jgi:hypothetical protein